MLVKKGDTIMITSGNDRGKKGKVMRAVPDDGKVIIEGLNLVWKHIRKSNKHPKGGRIRVEMPIAIAKVRIVCQSCDKPTRIKMAFLKNPQITKKSRNKVVTCKKCNEPIRPAQ